MVTQANWDGILGPNLNFALFDTIKIREEMGLVKCLSESVLSSFLKKRALRSKFGLFDHRKI